MSREVMMVWLLFDEKAFCGHVFDCHHTTVTKNGFGCLIPNAGFYCRFISVWMIRNLPLK